MNHQRRWSLVAVGLLLLLAGARVDAEELRFYGPDSYPPVAFLDSQGQAAGAMVRILRRVEMETGDRYDISLVPWNRAYQLAMQGKGGLLALSSTAERQRQFDYSVPLYVDELLIVVRRDRLFAFSTLDDLKGRLLAGATGSSYGETIDGAIAEGRLRVVPQYSVQMRLKSVLNGRVDGAIVFGGQAGLAADLAADPVLEKARDQLMALPHPLTQDTLYMGIPKKLVRAGLMERFDAAVTKLRRSGAWDAIIAGDSP